MLLEKTFFINFFLYISDIFFFIILNLFNALNLNMFSATPTIILFRIFTAINIRTNPIYKT